MSRERGVTPFMTMLGAFQTLLHRYTEQDDIAGTFTLSFDGQTTGPLAHDVSADAMKTALEAMSHVGRVRVEREILSTVSAGTVGKGGGIGKLGEKMPSVRVRATFISAKTWVCSVMSNSPWP